jgi:hypothetical protein
MKAQDILVESYPANFVKMDQYGITYSIEGMIKGEKGNLKVRSIWIVGEQNKNATFVTVYPLN